MIYDDLRVLDLSSGLASAYAAKLLTDLGAQIVHWEPEGGDRLRREDPHGALYAYLRTSQRAVGGDAASWVDGADLVLLSDPAPAGLPAALVAALRDRAGSAAARPGPLVVVEVSAVGHGGPDDGLDLPEPVLQARSGALSGHGHPGRTPLTVGGRIGEYVAGAFAALGAATAWRRASRAQRAELVDVSKLEAMQLTMLTVPTLMAHFPGGRGSTFRFVMIPGNEPTGDDRYIGITTITAAQWRALLGAMGRDDLAGDDELTTMIGRFIRAEETNTVLQGWTRTHTAAEIEAACSAARVPVAIVSNGELLPRLDQLSSRDVFVPQPGAAFVRPRAPFRFHHIGDREMEPAPASAESHAPPWSAREATAATVAAAERPLAGVRVLDFTAFWSGPFATAWLAAMGAEVIKVESVQRPDGIRFSAAVRPSKDAEYFEKSALFHAANLSKRGITLDLSQEEGREIARRLVARADVVAENFTPRVLDDFGFSYDAVRAIRPDVVMLRLPAFGLSGPWRDRPGFAQTMEQLTGMAWVTGYEGGPPIIAGGVVDPMVGAHVALAIVAALAHRDRTGEGGLVEMPMIEVAVATTAEQVIRFSEYGELMGRRGEGGVYRCAGDDEWVSLDVDADAMSPAERAAWCATRTKEDAAAALRVDGIAAWPVVPGHLAVDDPQLVARRFFQTIDNPKVGRQDYPTFPMTMSAGPHTTWTAPAPTLGQHTAEVLREIGVTDDELAGLHERHIIGDQPLAPG
jgi:crotonobetainyl-CoA:carnitine CoA-transferase CaiB-like acyl-CoA transferase